MIGAIPKRPAGTDAQSIFMQWVYDRLMSDRMIDTPGAATHRTTKGFRVIPKRQGGGGPGGDVLPVWL